MDSGPFSTPQPQDRRATTSRPPEPTYHRSAQAALADETTRPVRRAPSRYESPQPRKGKLWIIIGSVAAALIIAGVCVWLFVGRAHSTIIDKSKYQAVFFTNGQVYFGKLSALNGDYFKMTNVYYLQSDKSKDSQETQSPSSSNVKLIKLGSEIHGPEDEMAISRDQVMFYENLKADGKVAQAIQQAQSQQ